MHAWLQQQQLLVTTVADEPAVADICDRSQLATQPSTKVPTHGHTCTHMHIHTGSGRRVLAVGGSAWWARPCSRPCSRRADRAKARATPSPLLAPSSFHASVSERDVGEPALITTTQACSPTAPSRCCQCGLELSDTLKNRPKSLPGEHWFGRASVCRAKFSTWVRFSLWSHQISG